MDYFKGMENKFYAVTASKKDAVEWFKGQMVLICKRSNGKLITLVSAGWNKNITFYNLIGDQSRRYIDKVEAIKFVDISDAKGTIYIAK